MTKEEFENYEGTLLCMNCKKEVPKIHIEYKKVHKDGTIKKCNTCSWLLKHQELVNSINDFTYQEIITAVHFFIYEESIYINDLSYKLNIPIERAINLYLSLNIKGKKCKIKTICEYCNKEIEDTISVYLKNKNMYCSSECYWKDKSDKMPKGKNSKFYKRVNTKCTNCNKDILVIPTNFYTENSYGDKHNFCSKECYWEFRKSYYIGDKSPMTNHSYTDEQLENMRRTAFMNSRNSARLNSKIQIIINKLLDNNNIKYQREYVVEYYAIDNYLTDYNLMIEVMGDYWHSNPLRYNDNKYNINNIQYKGITKDKQKYSYIKNHYNIEILYLWESDINNNLELCNKLIFKYIQNNGILANYHSFNWYINNNNNNIELKNEMIIPYQNISCNDYKYLLQERVV